MSQERLALLQGDEMSHRDILPQFLGLNVGSWGGLTICSFSVQLSLVRNVSVLNVQWMFHLGLNVQWTLPGWTFHQGTPFWG
jgi:hypothetical protein